MDATVRTRLAWVIAAMDRHPIPGKTLHEGHGGLVVFLGVICEVLGQDGVGAGSRGVALDPCADGASTDLLAAAVDVEHLVVKVHDDADRARGRSLGIPDILVRLEVGRVRRLPGAMLNREGSQVQGREDENGGEQRGGEFFHAVASMKESDDQRRPSVPVMNERTDLLIVGGYAADTEEVLARSMGGTDAYARSRPPHYEPFLGLPP